MYLFDFIGNVFLIKTEKRHRNPFTKPKFKQNTPIRELLNKNKYKNHIEKSLKTVPEKTTFFSLLKINYKFRFTKSAFRTIFHYFKI